MIAGSQAARGTLITIGAFACCLVAAAPANAGAVGVTEHLGSSKGLEYKKATFEDRTFEVPQPVHCDVGTEGTGGGGSIGGPPVNAALSGSYPTTPDADQWVAAGSSVAAQDLTGYAICGDHNAAIATVDEQIAGGSSSGDSPVCASGEASPTGGGVEPSNIGVRIEATYPAPPDNWSGLAKNTAADERVVYFHAVCSERYIVRYRSSDPVRMKSGENAKVSVACKPKEAVLGGGFVALSIGLPASGSWGTVSKPRDSKGDANKVPDDGWFARAHNGSVVTHRLQAWAACKAGNAPV